MKCPSCGIDKVSAAKRVYELTRLINILFTSLKTVPVNGTIKELNEWTETTKKEIEEVTINA